MTDWTILVDKTGEVTVLGRVPRDDAESLLEALDRIEREIIVRATEALCSFSFR